LLLVALGTATSLRARRSNPFFCFWNNPWTKPSPARPPKGYEPIPDAIAEDIKLKSWVVSRKLTQKQIASPALVDDITGFALAAAPLLNFGWNALSAGPIS